VFLHRGKWGAAKDFGKIITRHIVVRKKFSGYFALIDLELNQKTLFCREFFETDMYILIGNRLETHYLSTNRHSGFRAEIQDSSKINSIRIPDKRCALSGITASCVFRR
jgi:hypothetical protein